MKARIVCGDGIMAAEYRVNADGTAEARPIEGVSAQEAADWPYLMSGLCDMHTHGNSGCDFSDGDYDEYVRMARFLYRNGVSSFAAALMTLPEEKLIRACRTAARFSRETPEGCARIAGVMLEGPFLSGAKKGAQSEEYLHEPDYDMFMRLVEASDGLVRVVCVAPELPGAMDFIARASKVCRVAVAHTDCDYQTASAAFAGGACHVTHLFNAMRPMLHRDPGPIPAAMERAGVTAELIADGVHVHPAMVRAAYKLFGAGRLCLISDAMSAAGMCDGEYSIGGQRVYVKDGRAALSNGTIAGSTAKLINCMRNVVSFGVRVSDAARMAGDNPRTVLKDQGSAGTLLLSPSLEIMEIYR